MTAHSVNLTCLPGYGGGEDDTILFPVLKSDPSMYPRPAKSSVQHNGQMVVITVTELIPNNNYTLYVFAKNSHGRSAASVNVAVRTMGRNTFLYAVLIFYLLKGLFIVILCFNRFI